MPTPDLNSSSEFTGTTDPERPRLEEVLPLVTLAAMTPAFTPGGPDAAILGIEPAQISKLLRAERRGTLEVKLPSLRPVE